MKLRLLNCGHQALAYLGHLAGHRLVHEAAADPLLAEFVLAYMQREGGPTVPPVPGIDLEAYQAELLERFRNPQVRDTVRRLCADSSDRISTWLLPVVRENLASGGEVALSATVVAAWARYAEGVDEAGEPIVVEDRLAERMTANARRRGEDPLSFLRDREVFGDLVDEPRFTEPYAVALASLHELGARATLARLLSPAPA
jgi:mannitol 2-dehydrogenase